MMYDYTRRIIILIVTQCLITIQAAINLLLVPFLTVYNSMVQEDQEFGSIFITGGSRGIGASVAEQYSKPGVNIFLYTLDDPMLEATKKACEEKGATVTVYIGNVTDKESLLKCVKAADATAPLDLVVANAGISNNFPPQTVVDVNVTGVLNVIHPVIEQMKTRKKGHVCLMGSVYSFIPGMPISGCYGAGKAFMLAYGRGLRINLKQFGISVTVACPGLVKTEMTRADLENSQPSGFAAFAKSRIDANALTPEKAANRICYANRRNLQDYLFPPQSMAFSAMFRAAWRRSTFTS